MPDFSKYGGILKKLAGKDWRIKLIILVGLAGMVLILIGQLRSNGSNEKKSDPSQEPGASAEYISEEEYTAQLEDRLGKLIGSVQGVGQVEIMVTLEHGVEYVYAQEEKSSLDKTMDTGGENESATIDYKYDSENSYVFVDSGYGEKQPLLKTKVPPKVQGVVVVCDGADDARVEQSVLNVVTTALNIPTTRVCVVKIDTN